MGNFNEKSTEKTQLSHKMAVLWDNDLKEEPKLLIGIAYLYLIQKPDTS